MLIFQKVYRAKNELMCVLEVIKLEESLKLISFTEYLTL